MTSETIAAANAEPADHETTTAVSAPGGRKENLFEIFFRVTELDLRTVAMLLALLSIWVGLYFLTNGLFLSPRNLTNLAVQGSVVAIMATGMVLVIVARHIDLSVGSVVGFTGMFVAWALSH